MATLEQMLIHKQSPIYCLSTFSRTFPNISNIKLKITLSEITALPSIFYCALYLTRKYDTLSEWFESWDLWELFLQLIKKHTVFYKYFTKNTEKSPI